ncbi:5-oxoprolinase subunit PxpA [Galbibacter sp.]|uniref:5-oxoprolinase subunit PxpA n=1 Tax=Galbibacter sp. TaxID=2918471 RepID=UPI003A8EC623
MSKPALNCDLGEGTNNEAQIMPLINSCSIACGGHAGDPQSMMRAIVLAKENNVFIGAHPSYPDRDNFGRVPMEMEDKQFILSIQQQLNTFDLLLQKHHMELHHIKAHGALYNEVVNDSNAALRYLKAIELYKTRCCLYVPFGSIIATLAKEHGFRIKYEAFGDRSYRDDLSLMSRAEPGAVIEDEQQVYQQIYAIVTGGCVLSWKGNKVNIKADTFCIHSDTANAVSILKFLQEQFQKNDFG